MADQHHGPGELREKGLQPLLAVEVEVVRRLVEQEQIGGREENPRQRGPGTLPTAHRGERLVELLFPELQSAEHALDLGLECEPSLGLELVAHAAVLLERAREPAVVAVHFGRGERGLEVGQTPFHRREGGKGRHGLIPECAGLIDRRILWKIADHRP